MPVKEMGAVKNFGRMSDVVHDGHVEGGRDNSCRHENLLASVPSQPAASKDTSHLRTRYHSQYGISFQTQSA